MKYQSSKYVLLTDISSPLNTWPTITQVQTACKIEQVFISSLTLVGVFIKSSAARRLQKTRSVKDYTSKSEQASCCRHTSF